MVECRADFVSFYPRTREKALSCRELYKRKLLKWEFFTQDESLSMVESIGDANGQAISLRKFLYPGVLNIKCALVFGKRYATQDPQFKVLQDLIAKWSTLVKSFFLVNVLPYWVEELLAMYPITKKGEFCHVARKLFDISGYDFFVDVFFLLQSIWAPATKKPALVYDGNFQHCSS